MEKIYENLLKNRNKSIIFERVNRGFCHLNIRIWKDTYWNYTLNYRFQIPLSKAHVKTIISPERQTIFIHFFRYFAEIIEFNRISSNIVIK